MEALGATQSRQRPLPPPYSPAGGIWLFLRPKPPSYLQYLPEPQMETATRHTATENHPSVGKSDSPSSSHAVPSEEPEYSARYLVVKHSWRGRYKRILCISGSTIITLDPNTLSVTNAYDVEGDFESAAPIIGRDESSSEFNISLRTDGRGKFKSFKFSSKYRASILTELHRIRWSRLGTLAEFAVLHLRRRTGEWVPLVSFVFYYRCLLDVYCNADNFACHMPFWFTF